MQIILQTVIIEKTTFFTSTILKIVRIIMPSAALTEFERSFSRRISGSFRKTRSSSADIRGDRLAKGCKGHRKRFLYGLPLAEGNSLSGAVKPYYLIRVNTSEPNYFYYVYESGGQAYIEIPYQGIYEADHNAIVFLSECFPRE